VHEVIACGAERTLVRQRFEQRGLIGAVVGRLLAGMTRRYLRMEADGLKAASETRAVPARGDDATPA
jgi:hypothetical protein